MPDEFAIILKALEIRADQQYKDIFPLLAEAKSETASWETLAETIGYDKNSNGTSAKISISSNSLSNFNKADIEKWKSVVENSRNYLSENGIEPNSISFSTLPDIINSKELIAAFLMGATAALLPSVGGNEGSVSSYFNHIQKEADSGHLSTLIQKIFGGNSDPLMDMTKEAGPFHRFAGGHDLFQILPSMVSEFGYISGTIRTFQHLLTDSFGRTGIPLPGTELFGNYIAKLFGGIKITDIISAPSLSHYSAFRATDLVSTGAVELLLFGFHKFNKTPENALKRPQMGIIAHGVAATALLIGTHLIPGFAMTMRWRSWINYTSMIAMVKHCWNLQYRLNLLKAKNEKDYIEILDMLKKLEEMRSGKYRENNYLPLMSEIESVSNKLTGLKIRS